MTKQARNNTSASSTDAAAKVYQDFLDETSGAVIHNAPEIFCARVLLPFVMRTARDETIVETEEDLVSDTRAVANAMHAMHITDFIRIVLRARFVTPDTIEGWHRTYLLRGANALTPPYENRLVQRLVGDTWKVTLSEHELSSLGGLPLAYMQSAPGSFAEQWGNATANLTDPPIHAEPVYTAFLSSLDRANAENDFEAWAKHFVFPLAWHLTDRDQLVESAEEIREIFFENQNKLMLDGREARVHRRINKAEFLQDGRILGYHELEWRDGDSVLFGPVTSRVVLRVQDDKLAAEDISNNLDTALFQEGTLARTGALPTFREIHRRTQAKANQPANNKPEQDNKDDPK